MMSPRIETVVDGAAIGVTVALLASVGLDLGSPLRLVLALTFVTIVPGWALLDHIRIVDGPSKLALAVGISLSCCVVLSTILLWIRVWQPMALLTGLAIASLTALSMSLVYRGTKTSP